jgi:hypothetical protein
MAWYHRWLGLREPAARLGQHLDWRHERRDPHERERLERERFERVRRYGVAPPVGYPAVVVAPPAAPTDDGVAPPTGDGGGGALSDDMGVDDAFHER